MVVATDQPAGTHGGISRAGFMTTFVRDLAAGGQFFAWEVVGSKLHLSSEGSGADLMGCGLTRIRVPASFGALTRGYAVKSRVRVYRSRPTT